LSHVLSAWLGAFLFTQAVEVPIYLSALRRADDANTRAPRPLARRLVLAFGASMITHPIVWFVIPLLPYRHYWEMVLRAEAFAFAVEGIYLGALGVQRPFLWSLVANGASVTLGLTSRHLFGWP